jgi:hypothetical protein
LASIIKEILPIPDFAADLILSAVLTIHFPKRLFNLESSIMAFHKRHVLTDFMHWHCISTIF